MLHIPLIYVCSSHLTLHEFPLEEETYFSLSPSHLDMRSEEETEKNVELLASVATALARYDFPVPGGPNSKMPLQGVRLPGNTQPGAVRENITAPAPRQGGNARFTGTVVKAKDGPVHSCTRRFNLPEHQLQLQKSKDLSLKKTSSFSSVRHEGI